MTFGYLSQVMVQLDNSFGSQHNMLKVNYTKWDG